MAEHPRELQPCSLPFFVQEQSCENDMVRQQHHPMYNLPIADDVTCMNQQGQMVSNGLSDECFSNPDSILGTECREICDDDLQQNINELASDTGRSSRNSNMTTSATQTSDGDCRREPLSSEPQISTGSSMLSLSSIYQGEWPIDDSNRVLWLSGPSCIGEKDSLSGLVNQDTCSIMSFSSAGLTSSSMNARRFHAHQLGTKVEMVYSLLSMLGTHDKEDMSRTLLAMSSSQDSCIAMRQSGCLPLLVQLLHGGERDSVIDEDPQAFRQVIRDARRRASQALHNIVHAHPDDKRGRREARVLRLLEQIRDYCDLLRDIDAGFVEDNNNVESIDQHPGPAIAALMKLSFDEEHRHAMCQLGGLQAIAELIQIDHEVHGNTSNQYCVTIRRYAGMALTNLTFGDGTNKALLCSMRNFMHALVAQLHSPSEDLRQVTASVLRNLSWRADTASKQMLREVGAVSTLMKAAMDATKESILKSILSALWNLSAHCTMNKADICAVDGALAFLVSTLTYKSSSKTLAIIENGGGILRNISSHIAVKEEYRAILRKHKCLQLLLQQLKSPSLTVVSNACGTLWNLSARCPEDQQALWEMGAVSMLRNLVHSKHKMISMGSSAALRNLLSAKPAGMAYGLSRSENGTTRCNGQKSNMPSLLVRKQRALEAEIDQNLSETYDNIDSPKTSPTHTAENRFSFSGHSNKRDQAQYSGYLPGRMYLSIDGCISTPNGVSRSESRDSIGSTHSEPLPPHLLRSSYQIFAKSARLMLLNRRQPERPFDFQSMEHELSKDDHNHYSIPVFPNNIQRMGELRRFSGGNAPTQTEEEHRSLPRPNSLPSVRRDKIDLSDDSDTGFERLSSNGTHPAVLRAIPTRATRFQSAHKKINGFQIERIPYRMESARNSDKIIDNNFMFTDSKQKPRQLPQNGCASTDEYMSSFSSRANLYRQNLNEDTSFQYLSHDQGTRNGDETTYSTSADQSMNSLDNLIDGSNMHNFPQPNMSSRAMSYNQLTKLLTDDKKTETTSSTERRHSIHEHRISDHGSSVYQDKSTSGNYNGCENSYMVDTPIMFSPCSSQCSLSSFEQQSIHEDRTSVISDASHRNSWILSPSDIPESPGFTRPSTPSILKQPISQFTDAAPKHSEGIVCPIPSSPKVSNEITCNGIDNYASHDDEFSLNGHFATKPLTLRNRRLKHAVYSDSEVFKMSSPITNGKVRQPSPNRAVSSDSLFFNQRAMAHERIRRMQRQEIDCFNLETYEDEMPKSDIDISVPSVRDNYQSKQQGRLSDSSTHSTTSSASTVLFDTRLSNHSNMESAPTPPPPPPPPPVLFFPPGNGNSHFSSISHTQYATKSLMVPRFNGSRFYNYNSEVPRVSHAEQPYATTRNESRDIIASEPLMTINEDPSQSFQACVNLTKSKTQNSVQKSVEFSNIHDNHDELVVDVKKTKNRDFSLGDSEEKCKQDERIQEKNISTAYSHCNGELSETEVAGGNILVNGGNPACSIYTTKHSGTSSSSSPEGAISSSNGQKDIEISEASRIRREAKRVAEKVEAEVDNLADELTQSSVSGVSDLDNVLPPSVMGDALSLSMTSSGLSDVLSNNGKIPAERRHSLKKSRKSIRNRSYFHDSMRHAMHVDAMKVSSGSDVLEGVQPSSEKDSGENVSMKSSGTSDVLDNVNPPSVMDELSMTGSCASLNSISSDILESKSHSITDAPNGKSNNSEMFERFNAAAAMVQVYSRELSNIMTGSMKSSYNSDIIDQVKPPSCFQEITEVTVEDGTEVASDTLASDTELEEELPRDDEASALLCEAVHSFNISQLVKEEQRQESAKNLASTVRKEPVMGQVQKRKKLLEDKINGDMTAEEVLALQENAKLVVSTIQEIKNKTTANEMLEDEIMSLVSLESEENVKSERRGPRIVKPINRETIRQMQEKKNAEKTGKGIRGRACVRAEMRNNIRTTNTVKTNVIKPSTPPSVKPTRTSALRASQNQRSASNRNLIRTSGKSTINSYLNLSKPLSHMRNGMKFERSTSSLDKENIPQNTDLRNINAIRLSGGHSSTDSDDGRPRPLVKQATFTKDTPSQNAPHISPTSQKHLQQRQQRSPLAKSTTVSVPVSNRQSPVMSDGEKQNLTKGNIRGLPSAALRSKISSTRRSNSFKKGNTLKTSPSAQSLGRQTADRKFHTKRSPSAANLSSHITSVFGSSQSTTSNASSLSSLSSGASIKKGPVVRKDVPSKIAFLWKKSASDGCASDGSRNRGAFSPKLKSGDVETGKHTLSRSLTIRTRSSFITATSSSGDGLSRSSTYDKLSQESSQSGSDKDAPKRPTTLTPSVPSGRKHPIKTNQVKGIVHCHHSHETHNPPVNTWKKTRLMQKRGTVSKAARDDKGQTHVQSSTNRNQASTSSVETSDENETSALKSSAKTATGLIVVKGKTENEDHQNSNLMDADARKAKVTSLHLDTDEDEKPSTSANSDSEEDCIINSHTGNTSTHAGTYVNGVDLDDSDLQGEQTPYLVTTV